MENQTTPMVYLWWLQKNTSHYQYRTQEAIELKSKIEKCSSEEEAVALDTYYKEFVRLSERNPFDGTDERGEKAAILAESFFYLFYPNSSGQYIPMQIFLTMGGVATEEAASLLYERMQTSLKNWKRETKARASKQKEQTGYAARSVAAVYGTLLNQPRGSLRYFAKQFMMFVLLILTGMQICQILTGPDFRMADGLTKGAVYYCSILTVLFLIRSVQWMRGEKKRKEVLREWDYCVRYSEEYETRKGGSFRNPAALQKLIKSEILKQSEKDAETGAAKVPELPQREPDFMGLFAKKNIKACSTIRITHLVLMLLVLVCVTLLSPVNAPVFLREPVMQLQLQVSRYLDTSGLRNKASAVYAQEQMSDLGEEIQFALRTLQEGEVLLDEPSGSQEVAWCAGAGSVLYPLGVKWDMETESYWYYAADMDGYLGYVPATACEVYDGGELSAAEMILKDADGNSVSDRSIGVLCDRSPMTGCNMASGETLDIKLNRGSRIQYLYLINGDVTSETAFWNAGRVKKLKLVFDETQEYYVELPDTDQCEPLGCFVRIPDIVASKVRIEILETVGEDSARLSELKICGQHML